MRINKEEFNKLPQLDRIEFRQKINLIGKIKSNGVIHLAFYCILGALITATTGFLEIAEAFAKITWILLFLHIFMRIIETVMISSYTNKLEKEYFKTGLKKK